MLVDYYTYKAKDFTCPKCGWAGQGKDLTHGDFSEEHVIGNLECPKCYHLIAFWQAPLSDDKNKPQSKQ